MSERRLAFTLAFHGRIASGWQRQTNQSSIQQLTEDAFSQLQSGPVKVYACSRTDTGVHARSLVCAATVRDDIPPAKWLKGVNTALPDDVAVQAAAWAPDDFAPRSACGEKTYVYRFRFAAARDPLHNDREWWVPDRLDRGILADVAATWKTQRDFRAACSRRWSGEGSTVRTLSESRIDQDGDACQFVVRGPGFLTHQVRILAGTLVDVGRGNLTPDSVAAALDNGDRGGLGITAPARGLTLESVVLPQIDWQDPWPADGLFSGGIAPP